MLVFRSVFIAQVRYLPCELKGRSAYKRDAVNVSLFPIDICTASIYTLFTPMSNPISHLENLGINEMPETRSQRQRAQREAGRAISGSGRGRGRAAGPPPSIAPPIQGHSGTLYDVQSLSPDSSVRMAEGVATDFWVDELRRHPLSHPTYFAFQLKKPVSVRIHDPENGNNRVECSCDDNSTCCIHIYVSTTST